MLSGNECESSMCNGPQKTSRTKFLEPVNMLGYKARGGIKVADGIKAVNQLPLK